MDLYRLLGVPRDATTTEIDDAYLGLAGAVDIDTYEGRHLRMLLEHAHKVLTDPVRRAAYDRSLADLEAAVRAVVPGYPAPGLDVLTDAGFDTAPVAATVPTTRASDAARAVTPGPEVVHRTGLAARWWPRAATDPTVAAQFERVWSTGAPTDGLEEAMTRFATTGPEPGPTWGGFRPTVPSLAALTAVMFAAPAVTGVRPLLGWVWAAVGAVLVWSTLVRVLLTPARTPALAQVAAGTALGVAAPVAVTGQPSGAAVLAAAVAAVTAGVMRLWWGWSEEAGSTHRWSWAPLPGLTRLTPPALRWVSRAAAVVAPGVLVLAAAAAGPPSWTKAALVTLVGCPLVPVSVPAALLRSRVTWLIGADRDGWDLLRLARAVRTDPDRLRPVLVAHTAVWLAATVVAAVGVPA